jgi:hypothetical protein
MFRKRLAHAGLFYLLPQHMLRSRAQSPPPHAFQTAFLLSNSSFGKKLP